MIDQWIPLMASVLLGIMAGALIVTGYMKIKAQKQMEQLGDMMEMDVDED